MKAQCNFDIPRKIFDLFCCEGKITEIEKNNSGNINQTYIITTHDDNGTKRMYTLQKVNTYVFSEPAKVMDNIAKVTDYLCNKYTQMYGSADRRCLRVVRTKAGEIFHDNPQDGFWRCFNYIDEAKGYDKVEKLEHFYMAGKAFGEFQKVLADFDASQLYETIPDFHNTPKRLDTFKKAVEENKAGRVDEVKEEIEFILSREKKAGKIVEMMDKGLIPLRVTHNDTKLNNVLIDDNTDEAICVIDLDTVMPGTSVIDFGDAVRFGASTGAEDEPDLAKVSLDLNLYELFTKGFVGEVSGFLTSTEIDNLPLGAYTVTLELAARFLTDYLVGDLYFKTTMPQHNLIRTRTQLKLVKEMESKWDAMNEIVSKYK